jgi:hypothetical protein
MQRRQYRETRRARRERFVRYKYAKQASRKARRRQAAAFHINRAVRPGRLVDVERERERVRDRSAGGCHSDRLVLHHRSAGILNAATASSTAGCVDNEQCEHQHRSSEIPPPAPRLNS